MDTIFKPTIISQFSSSSGNYFNYRHFVEKIIVVFPGKQAVSYEEGKMSKTPLESYQIPDFPRIRSKT